MICLNKIFYSFIYLFYLPKQSGASPCGVTSMHISYWFHRGANGHEMAFHHRVKVPQY